MTIWVDADALPRVAKDILVRASQTRSVRVVLVANGWLQDPGVPNVEVILVAPGEDVAKLRTVEDAVNLIVERAAQ